MSIADVSVTVFYSCDLELIESPVKVTLIELSSFKTF